MSLKEQILSLTRQYYQEELRPKEYRPGDPICYGGRVFDEDELTNLMEATLDFWLTTGRFNEEFEKKFADFIGVKYCYSVNSGSSANLLAFMTLTSPLLKERRILPGDEVITVACGFPTTVAPIIQYGAVPVFLDITIPSYNIDVSMLEDAVSEKTKAVMLAHTLGNPFDVKTIRSFCDAHGLWLIEDNCDALGSEIDGKKTGSWGDIGTSSFYPPHHMTMGEGGAVYTNNALLAKILLSMRDWGRDCICQSGQDNRCGHRFDGQYGQLPEGYDHKYVYSHFGYNLKITDMQAAVGCAQLNKMPQFIRDRQKNWEYLREKLSVYSDRIILPEFSEGISPSWFGFVITLKSDSREAMLRHLDARKIQTRLIFAGNLLKQPCFDEMRVSGKGYRVVGELANTDRVMNDTFWIGVYPGMTKPMLDAMIEAIGEFFL